jgi:hypothetical protein
MNIGKYIVSKTELIKLLKLPYDADIMTVRKIKDGFEFVIEHEALPTALNVRSAALIDHWDLDLSD